MSSLAPRASARARRASVAAYGAAVAFAVGLSRFAVARAGYVGPDDGHLWGALAAALPHLLLLVGVLPVLRAAGWVKAAGLFWLVLDLLSDVLALAGVGAGTFLTVRFVGHLGAAVWIACSSWPSGGTLRVVGVLTAGFLGLYTFVSPWVPPIALAPSGPLLIAWCALIGHRLARTGG